jgi:hypothetical protein
MAEFTFVGTVRGIGTSDVPTIPASDATVTVEVEQVLHAPDALAGYAGQVVTVLLASAGSVTEGERATFFTTVLALAEGLGLAELEHHPADAAGGELAGRVAAAKGAVADQHLQDRIARADLVVSGRVVDVRPPPAEALLASDATEPRSEHDPYLQVAVIAVDSVVKGEQPAGETTVLFASSMDIAWYRAPKFAVGDQGVYLLHSAETAPEVAPALRPGGPAVLVALDPLDVQPPGEIDHVRQLSPGTG